MSESLRGKPKLYGVIREGPRYNPMGNGLTSNILLIGHADGLDLNDPYQVPSMKEAVNLLQADQNSPLLRALFEVYNAGARDVWLMAAAPMSEYVADIEDRFTKQFMSEEASPTLYDFYEKYYERLTATYSVLADYDIGEIVLPVEAVYYDTGSVDFAGQLIRFCNSSFEANGLVKLGFLGTRTRPSKDMDTIISELSDTTRLESYRDGVSLDEYNGSKFVSTFFGEGIFSHSQFSNSYRAPLVHSVAANAAVMGLERSVPFVPLKNVLNITGRDLTKDEIDSLLAAQVNPVIRNTRARRGQTFNIVPMTDNTMGNYGTDFWSLSQMRLIARCANTIRVMGWKMIGTTDMTTFKKNVYEYLMSLISSGAIKNFTANVERSKEQLDKVFVDVTLIPYFGLREIYFTVEAGPGA